MRLSSTLLGSCLLPWLLLPAAVALAQPGFVNKLPIPPLVDAANGPIDLQMQLANHKFNPGQPASILNGGFNQPDGMPTLTYNIAGSSALSVLGPTQVWHRGDSVHIRLTNLIGDHSTTHWHGAEVPPEFDGGPHQEIHPNTTWDIKFKVLDYPSTLWYHPHLHNHTVQQVQKGLSGMIIVQDANDPLQTTLPHTYGVDDIPVIVGDMGVIRDTISFNPLQISYFLDTVKGRRPFNVVNGVNSPYVEVPAHVVRLRILNGSTRKGIKFGFSEAYNYTSGSLLPFYQIGTDGGYVTQSMQMTSLMNGPGSREEVVVDLSNYSPGDVLYLANFKASLPNYIIGSPLQAPNGGGKDSTAGNAFLQLRIVADNTFPGYVPVTSFTPFTRPWEPDLQDTTGVVRHRLKQLVMTTSGNENMFTIDGHTYHMDMLNDTVCVNTKEIWTIDNTTQVAHPFHIHKIQFRVLEIDSLGTSIDPASRGFGGPKDDVLVLPNWKLSFLGSFDDYARPIDPTNGYMYHCHILTHEDSVGGGMMHQFVVTDQGDCEDIGVNQAGDPLRMTLFPNPSTGTFFLRGAAGEPSRVRLLDLHGRLIHEAQLAAFNGEMPIAAPELPAGIYLVEWQTMRGRATGKIVFN